MDDVERIRWMNAAMKLVLREAQAMGISQKEAIAMILGTAIAMSTLEVGPARTADVLESMSARNRAMV